MRKYRRTYFDDPDDLNQWSCGISWMFQRLDLLDFARRYFARKKDILSQRKAEEIKEALRKTTNLQADIVSAFVTSDIVGLWWKTRNNMAKIKNRKTGI
jgi:hypothetical protein